MCFGWSNSSQKEPKNIRFKRNKLGDLRRDPEDTHLSKTDHFLGVYLTAQRANIYFDDLQYTTGRAAQ